MLVWCVFCGYTDGFSHNVGGTAYHCCVMLHIIAVRHNTLWYSYALEYLILICLDEDGRGE